MKDFLHKNPFAKFCEWYVEPEEEKKELSVDTTADDSIEDSPIPDDEPSESKENSGEKEKKEKKKNEELEEKPVHEPTSKETEESHGGDESTDSIEDSPNPGDEPSEAEESSGEDGGSGSTADSNAGEQNGGTCGTGISNKGASGDKNEGSEPSDGEGEENSEKEGSEPSDDEGEENSKKQNSGGSSGGSMNSGSLFGSDCQSTGIISRRFNAAFVRVIDEMNGRQLTEESGNILSVQELLRRKLTKQSLSRCYVSEKKPEVVIVLDSSGSMSEVIPVLEQLSEYAKRMFGNLVLEAPNMQISEEDEEAFNSAEVLFFVGDFDGVDVILGAAKAGKEVYWLCNESRYDDPTDHSWCSYGYAETERILSSNNMHYVRCCCLGEPEFNEKLWLKALNKLI